MARDARSVGLVSTCVLSMLAAPGLWANAASDEPPGATPAAAKSTTETHVDSHVAHATDEQPATQSDSSDNWEWILGIVLTAIISPIIVKLAEKWVGRDPIQEKTSRLQKLLDLHAARTTLALPPDGRLVALINEVTDALADEAKGKQQPIDDATSFTIGTLTSRLLESLFSSCRYMELLLDSKHRSDALLAIHDLQRLEFLRAYWAYRRMAVPQRFMGIKVEDLDGYAANLEALGVALGDNATQHASAIGSSPEDVQAFIEDLRREIRNAARREVDEGKRTPEEGKGIP